MSYGEDFLLEEGDIVFSQDGDAKVVEGAKTIAQDIASELKTPLGGLWWDREAGSKLVLFINESGIDPDVVVSEIERVAIADPRVDPQSVSVEYTGGSRYKLVFTPLQSVSPETLYFDQSEFLGD